MMSNLSTYITPGTPARIVQRYEQLAAIAQVSDFGAFDRNVVILDTETTGVSYKRDELTQIAAARLEQGVITDWYVTFVNPGIPIDPEVADLTAITDELVKDAPQPDEALAGLAAFVGDAKIVAHNAEFDKTFTTAHPSGYPLLENLWIDSLDLARIALPRLKSHRLLDLARAFDTVRSHHRADADVESLAQVYRILLAAVDAMPPMLVEAIAELDDGTHWSTVAVFRQGAERLNAKGQKLTLGALRRHVLGKLPSKRRLDGAGQPLDSDDGESSSTSSVQNAIPLWEFPSPETVASLFEANGVVARLYDSYEQRPEQIAMARAVAKAFSTSTNLVVEAGTGVGKSLAYGVPAALTVKANPIAVGIATKTNALLDQLVYKDLPPLFKALGLDAPIVPLKGYSHYPCLLKVERALKSNPPTRRFKDQEVVVAPSLAALLSFIEQSDYDDIDSLKIDYRALPRRTITTSSYECLRRKCPYFGSACFVHGSRLWAESAGIVVTNHALLLRDLAVDGGLLPPIRYWVIDEAHGFEEEARSAFALTLSAETLQEIRDRLVGEKESYPLFTRIRGVVDAAENASTPVLYLGLEAKAKLASTEQGLDAQKFLEAMRDLLKIKVTNRGQNYETVELWINDEVRSSKPWAVLLETAQGLYKSTEKLIKACQELVGYLEEIEGAAVVQRETAALTMRLKDLLNAIQTILIAPNDAYVYAAVLSRKGDKGTDRLEAKLFDVGASLNQTLFDRTHSVVFTSATLAINESFESFTEGLGIGSSEASIANQLILSSSYDYDNQMRIYVVSDMPEPQDERYLDALQSLLLQLHRAQNGSMLTLFTNRREMEKSYETIAPQLRDDQLRLVCQRWGVSIKGLQDDFLTDESLSLFALKSFWEGFDAPGSTLRGVVLPKLPFAKPTDPLSCERMARDSKAWARYVLPQAVRETQQAIGRLIRSAQDQGIVVLADVRLLKRSYGKTFLSALPSKDVRVMSAADIIAEVKADNS